MISLFIPLLFTTTTLGVSSIDGLSSEVQSESYPLQETFNAEDKYLDDFTYDIYGAEWGHDEYFDWQPAQSLACETDGPYDGAHRSIFVPSSTPEHASPPVDPDFIGFAFEEASFPRYMLTQDGKDKNNFSLNLIDAIVSRTGATPIIRLGGTSADFAKYIPTQKEPALPWAEKNTHQNVGGTTIGPSYWDVAHNVPNAVYVIQVPMANTNLTESLVWARTAAEHIGLDRIQAFEPGNEADIYRGGPRFPPPKWQGKLTNETYTGNFTKYANAIKEELGLEGPWFQAFDTGAHIGKDVLATKYILDVETNFNLGINEGNIVKTVAQHWYQTGGGKAADLSRGLMQHSKIVFRTGLLRKFIDYLRSDHPHIPFIISEIGNSLNPTYNHDYQAVLGSALWSVDFQLHTMTIGVARINWQCLMHAGYQMWLPIDSAGFKQQTMSSFYAMPFIGDFIGTGGKTRAVELNTGFENIPAYAAYVDDKPVRVAIVNMEFWDLGNGERPKALIALDVPEDCEEVKVDVLSSPQGAHAYAANITYAGSQWTAASEGKEVKGVRNDSRILEAEYGKVYLEVESSSAVLVHFL